MKRMMSLTVVAMLTLGAGQAQAQGTLPPGPKTQETRVEPNAISPQLKALVTKTVPGFTVEEVVRKEREGRVYWDVEGKRPDGQTTEIDIQERKGKLVAVEVQRDVPVAELPPKVTAAAKASFTPERVIESRQVQDGSIVYELFEPGRKDEPAIEVRVKGKKVERLAQRLPH